MKKLIDVAIHNLELLTDETIFPQNKFTLQKYEMKEEQNTEKTESFDTICSLDDLEYPIYFTYHQIMNHIHSNHKLKGYTRKQLINLMLIGIDILYEKYETGNLKHPSFSNLLEDLDNKVFFIQQYYRYGWCLWAPTVIKEYLNSFCNFLLFSGDVCNHFVLAIHPGLGDNIDEVSFDKSSDDDEENDEENDEEEDETNKKED